MTNLSLRPYQTEALRSIAAAEAEGFRRLLLQMATGLGKTIVFGTLATETAGRSLILAHRDELIEQAVERLRFIDNKVDLGVVKAERFEVDHQIIVASVQTLARERRRQGLGDFARVIVDEAHHAAAPTYRRILTDAGVFAPDGPRLLGVTATPVRGDRVGLDTVFEMIVFEYPILKGIENGYLSDLRGLRVTLAGLNLDRVTTRQGDWQAGQLGDALEEANAPEHIAAAYRDHAFGRKTIVFTPTVQLAKDLIEPFQRVGATAEVVHGEQPVDERRAVLSRFRSGETSVIANCAVLTEGFDEPATDCIIIARPTQSEALYVQMVGRGTRRHPGKDDCLVIDVVGATARHSLQTVSTLFGLPPETLANGRSVVEVFEEQRQEEQRRVAAGALQAQIVDLFSHRAVHWVRAGGGWALATGRGHFLIQPDGDQWRLIEAQRDGRYDLGAGPLDWLMGQAEDRVREAGAAALVAKDAPWRARPASEKQVMTLAKMRVPFRPGLTAGEASDLIGQAIMGRRRTA